MEGLLDTAVWKFIRSSISCQCGARRVQQTVFGTSNEHDGDSMAVGFVENGENARSSAEKDEGDG